MSRPLVYLSGPITGLDFKGCTDWREYARRALDDLGIDGLSPLRGKEFLRDAGKIVDGMQSVAEYAMSQDAAIVTRDRFDTTRADFLIVNLLGAERVSIGTMVELGWADAARVPVVLVMEQKHVVLGEDFAEEYQNIHEHPFVRQLSGSRVETLDEALDLVGAALAPRGPDRRIEHTQDRARGLPRAHSYTLTAPHANDHLYPGALVRSDA